MPPHVDESGIAFGPALVMYHHGRDQDLSRNPHAQTDGTSSRPRNPHIWLSLLQLAERPSSLLSRLAAMDNCRGSNATTAAWSTVEGNATVVKSQIAAGLEKGKIVKPNGPT